MLSDLVSLCTRLFYIQSKPILCFVNPWILLFPIIYKYPCFIIVLTEKSAVCDEEVFPSLFCIDSLITALQQNICQKLFLKKKNIFFGVFFEKSRNSLLYNFVERIELYYYRAVQEKPTFFLMGCKIQ
jgi:hypothetical protein